MIDNRYKLTNVLGKGASSKVFLATDHDDCKYAMKVLTCGPKLPYKAACVMAVREAEVLECLQGHPNIIQSYETNLQGVITHNSQSESVVYTKLEYAANGAISDFVRFSGAIEEQVAHFFFSQICYAIQFIHENKFVHLDIKLENILLDEFFNIKIADMGCAMNLDSSPLVEKRRGTALYMAPEVKNKEKTESYNGYAADIYSLGVALYVMLIGEFPNHVVTNASLATTNSGSYDSQSESSPLAQICKQRWEGLSDEVKTLIEGMMCPDAEKRLTIKQIFNSNWMQFSQDPNICGIVYEEMSARKDYILAKYPDN